MDLKKNPYKLSAITAGLYLLINADWHQGAIVIQPKKAFYQLRIFLKL